MSINGTKFFDSSSSNICWQACDKSNFVNFVPPDTEANSSSSFGSGYWSRSSDEFTVTL